MLCDRLIAIIDSQTRVVPLCVGNGLGTVVCSAMGCCATHKRFA